MPRKGRPACARSALSACPRRPLWGLRDAAARRRGAPAPRRGRSLTCVALQAVWTVRSHALSLLYCTNAPHRAPRVPAGPQACPSLPQPGELAAWLAQSRACLASLAALGRARVGARLGSVLSARATCAGARDAQGLAAAPGGCKARPRAGGHGPRLDVLLQRVDVTAPREHAHGLLVGAHAREHYPVGREDVLGPLHLGRARRLGGRSACGLPTRPPPQLHLSSALACWHEHGCALPSAPLRWLPLQATLAPSEVMPGRSNRWQVRGREC